MGDQFQNTAVTDENKLHNEKTSLENPANRTESENDAPDQTGSDNGPKEPNVVDRPDITSSPVANQLCLKEDHFEGTSSSSAEQFCLKGNKFYVLLTGNTLKVHEEFVHRLINLKGDLQKVNTAEESDFLLVFCPVVSRAGTDIQAAVEKLENVAGNKPAVLMILHHTFDKDCVVPDSSRAVTRSNSITVDCLFHEDQGLLQCPKNKESLNRIVNIAISSQDSSESYFNWLADYMASWLTYVLHYFPSYDRSELESHVLVSQSPKEDKRKQDLKTNENDESVLRLVVLGRKDSGKSSAKNIILSKEEKSQTAATTATSTQKSEMTQGEVAGKKVIVVDTPDWFSSGLSLMEIRKDVDLCVRLFAPGLHAFLLVIPLKNPKDKVFNVEDVLKMEELFGERIFRNTIILFTITDELQKKDAENLIQSKNLQVQALLEKCGNRFYCLNIKECGGGSQVSELLEKIEMLKGSEKLYSSEMYLKTLTRIGEIEKKIVEKLERGQAMEQNTVMASQNMHVDGVTMEAEEDKMKILLHEIRRRVLTASMKMQEEIMEKDRQIEEKDKELEEWNNTFLMPEIE